MSAKRNILAFVASGLKFLSGPAVSSCLLGSLMTACVPLEPSLRSSQGCAPFRAPEGCQWWKIQILTGIPLPSHSQDLVSSAVKQYGCPLVWNPEGSQTAASEALRYCANFLFKKKVYFFFFFLPPPKGQVFTLLNLLIC